MKRRILVLIALILLPMLIVNVHASSAPYEWIVGGETVNTNPNSAGTARLEKDGKKITLYLKNYDGGALELNCYGTGQSDIVFILNLEGENKIKSDNIGINMGESNATKLTMEGSGTLVITAPTPISNEDYKDSFAFGALTNEEPEKVTSTQEETKENSLIAEKEDDDTLIVEKDSDNTNLIYIIFGIYAAISLVIILLLTIKVMKK